MYVFFKALPSSLLFLCYQYRDYSTFLLDWVVLAVMHSVNNVSLVSTYCLLRPSQCTDSSTDFIDLYWLCRKTDKTLILMLFFL